MPSQTLLVQVSYGKVRKLVVKNVFKYSRITLVVGARMSTVLYAYDNHKCVKFTILKTAGGERKTAIDGFRGHLFQLQSKDLVKTIS